MDSKDCEITEICIGKEKLPFEKATLTMNKEPIDGNPSYFNVNVWTYRPTPIVESDFAGYWSKDRYIPATPSSMMHISDVCKKLMDDVESLRHKVISLLAILEKQEHIDCINGFAISLRHKDEWGVYFQGKHIDAHIEELTGKTRDMRMCKTAGQAFNLIESIAGKAVDEWAEILG